MEIEQSSTCEDNELQNESNQERYEQDIGNSTIIEQITGNRGSTVGTGNEAAGWTGAAAGKDYNRDYSDRGSSSNDDQPSSDHNYFLVRNRKQKANKDVFSPNEADT